MAAKQKKIKIIKKGAKTPVKKVVAKPKEKGTINGIKEAFSKHKKYIISASVIALIAVFLYFGKGIFVAAMVNGTPVTRLEVIKDLEKQGGSKTLEALINKKLILSEARKKNIVINEVTVQEEIDKITKLVEAQGMKLDDALSFQGMTLNDLKERIVYQKTLESLLSEKLAVSDEEVQKYFDQNKTLYGSDTKFDNIKEDIRGQLKQDKLVSESGVYIEDLKKNSKIIYFVNF